MKKCDFCHEETDNFNEITDDENLISEDGTTLIVCYDCIVYAHEKAGIKVNDDT